MTQSRQNCDIKDDAIIRRGCIPLYIKANPLWGAVLLLYSVYDLPELHCGVVDEDNGVLWGDFALWGAPQNESCSNKWKLAIWTYFMKRDGASQRG